METMIYEERCANCACLVEKDGEWFCDESQEFCEEIEQGECPEGI